MAKKSELVIEIRQPQKGETVWDRWAFEADVYIGKQRRVATIQLDSLGANEAGVHTFIIAGVRPPELLERVDHEQFTDIARVAIRENLGL